MSSRSVTWLGWPSVLQQHPQPPDRTASRVHPSLTKSEIWDLAPAVTRVDGTGFQRRSNLLRQKRPPSLRRYQYKPTPHLGDRLASATGITSTTVAHLLPSPNPRPRPSHGEGRRIFELTQSRSTLCARLLQPCYQRQSVVRRFQLCRTAKTVFDRDQTSTPWLPAWGGIRNFLRPH